MYLLKDYITFRILIFVMKFYSLVYNGYFANRVVFFLMTQWPQRKFVLINTSFGKRAET